MFVHAGGGNQAREEEAQDQQGGAPLRASKQTEAPMVSAHVVPQDLTEVHLDGARCLLVLLVFVLVLRLQIALPVLSCTQEQSMVVNG